MEFVKFNSTMRRAYEAWRNSHATMLWEVYDNWSIFKDRAYEYCKNKMYEHDSYDGRIISANTTQFTYGFTYVDKEGLTHFVYITKDHDRDCIID